jgi:hypothetical protein
VTAEQAPVPIRDEEVAQFLIAARAPPSVEWVNRGGLRVLAQILDLLRYRWREADETADAETIDAFHRAQAALDELQECLPKILPCEDKAQREAVDYASERTDFITALRTIAAQPWRVFHEIQPRAKVRSAGRNRELFVDAIIGLFQGYSVVVGGPVNISPTGSAARFIKIALDHVGATVTEDAIDQIIRCRGADFGSRPEPNGDGGDKTG